jgi:hypothetical protein
MKQRVNLGTDISGQSLFLTCRTPSPRCSRNRIVGRHFQVARDSITILRFRVSGAIKRVLQRELLVKRPGRGEKTEAATPMFRRTPLLSDAFTETNPKPALPKAGRFASHGRIFVGPKCRSLCPAVKRYSTIHHLTCRLSGGWLRRKGLFLYPSIRTSQTRPLNSIDRGHRLTVKRAGIKPDFRLYDFRHTFGLRSAMAGVDLATLKERVGHTSITTTKRYVHRTPEHKRQAMEKLEQFNVELTLLAPAQIQGPHNFPHDAACVNPEVLYIEVGPRQPCSKSDPDRCHFVSADRVRRP